MIDYRMEDTSSGWGLTLCGDLTIENSERLKGILVEAMEGRDRLAFDLAGVTALDAAGFQLLWAASRTAGCPSGAPGPFEGLSEELKQTMTDAGYALGDGISCRTDPAISCRVDPGR